ncbi:hypothetical protein ILYODFUR_024009 [Ilyodon furcidens]|uniref:Uncharacterized protein n=1 Tax=Ilyodon furcidens TaxID=33524 RepID=A0ABV0TL48_9TELE
MNSDEQLMLPPSFQGDSNETLKPVFSLTYSRECQHLNGHIFFNSSLTSLRSLDSTPSGPVNNSERPLVDFFLVLPRPGTSATATTTCKLFKTGGHSEVLLVLNLLCFNEKKTDVA